MNVDIEKVMTMMAEQIGSLTKENIIFRVLVQQLEDEVQFTREAQVKKERSGVQTSPTAS
jgi:hypothetical protein